MRTANHAVITKPSIVKDALYGLLSATIIGLITSLTFILLVMLMSSHAFASSNSNALFPATVNLTATAERGYFLTDTGNGSAGNFKRKDLLVKKAKWI
jgi:hypothetical protein